ncbi:Cytochrome c oxidase assembly protein like [Actinidia chinensis var. chinensis]|uniref:Cytochrome c oxidase assembly protein like n=1 Tax=Actinidia chinensis var. chinensis TaxID=1590841 RepID=A0A2R6R632_ACTCC|nr:Cytochrome c oxidase assembly protein like [Actinidia chinensis var. chinensis]
MSRSRIFRLPQIYKTLHQSFSGYRCFCIMGCSYAAVLLYRRFYQVTGYGGTVQRREVRVLKERLLDMLKREPSPPERLWCSSMLSWCHGSFFPQNASVLQYDPVLLF